MSMKLYKTKMGNVVNLDQVTTIYKDPETLEYRVSFTSGLTVEMPDLDETDIANIMDYNNYLID